ncbi:MAG: hypothetical protein P0107_09735, partial [Nitrosomonas sp.]|nr:hypothetical protein [Nitrosomonas sp.]
MQRWPTGKQGAGIWMLRIFKNIFGISLFHYITSIHHNNPVSKLTYQSKIMADENDSNIFFELQFFNQLQDTFLHSNIQGSSR